MSEYPIFEEGAERSFTTGRTAAEQEAWVNSQDPKESFTIVDDDYETDLLLALNAENEMVELGEVIGDDATGEEPSETVLLTIRVPEQFFTQKFERSYWEGAIDPTNEYPIGDYFDSWMSDTDPDMELYGPDGQQVPLW